MGWGTHRLAVGSNDAEILAWLRRRADGSLVAGGLVDVAGPALVGAHRDDRRPDPDPRGSDAGIEVDRTEGTELVVASIGADEGGRRGLHRALDHAGHTWCSSLDRAAVADAVARYLLDRRAADAGGTWFRLAAVVPAGTSPASTGADPAASPPGSVSGRSVPRDDRRPASPIETVPVALVLAGARWRERATPALRRAGLELHPSPLLPLDAATATAPLPAAWAFPGDGDHPSRVLRPVVLVGDLPSGDDAEVVRSLADAATTRDQAHLDAAAVVAAATAGRHALDEPRALARSLADVLLTAPR